MVVIRGTLRKSVDVYGDLSVTSRVQAYCSQRGRVSVQNSQPQTYLRGPAAHSHWGEGGKSGGLPLDRSLDHLCALVLHC